MAGIPPVESSEDAFERAAAAGVALKRQFPAGRAEERVRDAALITQAGKLVSAAREVITASRANGNGHALALAPPAGGERLTREQLRTLAHGLRGWLDPELAALEKRLLRVIGKELGKELGKRDQEIAELEATALKDGDTWKPEKLFRPNQVTTYRGAMWVCREPNANVRPGTSDHWRLMHKTR